MGLSYGPKFQTISKVHFSETEVLTELKNNGDVRGFNIPPTILDGALHSLAIGLLRDDDTHLFLPVAIGRMQFYKAVEDSAYCHAQWKQNEGTNRTADLAIYTADGSLALKITDLQVQQVSLAAMRRMSGSGAERLVHHFAWKPHRFNSEPVEKTNWLLIANEGLAEFSENLDALLEEKGHQSKRVAPQQLADLEQLDFGSFDGVTWFVEDDATDIESETLKQQIAFIQNLLAKDHRRIRCGMQFVTTNAIDTATNRSSNSSSQSESDLPTIDPQQTKFWGFGRVISAEQPEFRCRLIDVADVDSATTSSLVDIMLTETQDNQFAIRGGQISVPRLVKSPVGRGELESDFSEGSYLITGGLGKLGRQAAKWLAEKGATQIVLVSRRDPDEETKAFIESIDCEVIVHAADVTCRDEVAELVSRFDDQYKPLSGLIHAAGVLDDALIESQRWERFQKVLSPKITAAKFLHELTKDLNLKLFVLYSSAASVLGSPGQSNYATGNAYLDGLAWRRRQMGLPATAINWGPWTEGMADDERILKRLALQGITPLSIEEAHAAMEKMLIADIPQATVMDVDWRRMRIGPTGDVPPILQELVGTKKRSRGGDSALVKQLKSMPKNAQRELLVKTVSESLQRILNTPDLPETDRPLIEMGLDSLMAVEFGTELQQMLGEDFAVGPTMLFDHPTIDAISDHVLELVVANTSTSDSKAQSATNPNVAEKENASSEAFVKREDIAIIGLSCRFPGAHDANEFWQNLLSGVDSVCDIPTDRWDIDRFYSEDREPGKMYTRQGGFLDDIAEFDAAFFGISEQEACWIDPQHRMLLENSYRALEDAGIPTQPLVDSNVGVFMGIMGQDYAFLPTLDDEEVIKGFQGAGLSHSAGVGRISYMFGFEGPSVAVDTASSSSLVALMQAVRSLQDRNCNLALAGGVNAILAPVNSLLMSKAGLLSPDGRCKSFSAEANGFGRGEGCGVVVLKRLSDAEKDGDRILAVVRGGAVVHNGFSGGITSPSSKAQSRVIDAALKDARVAPSQVQYLEAHGTGTEFGDPMELGAAVSVYGKGRKRDTPLLVGSVKANISHLEAAGGSSGLIKTVLAIHHGIIPPQIHLEEPNPHIPWKRMPVKLVAETTEWPECEQRLAGVTALGLVGTNAHVVLSSPPARPLPESAAKDASSVNDSKKSNLLVISARNETALKNLAEMYTDYIASSTEVDVSDICYTAGSGRRHLEYRLAMTVRSKQDAVAKLNAFCAGTALPNGSNGFANGSSNGSSNGSANGASNGTLNRPNIAGLTTGHAKSSPKIGLVFQNEFAKSPDEVLGQLRELYRTHDLVRETVVEFSDRLKEHLHQSNQSELCIQSLTKEESASKQIPTRVLSFVLQSCVFKLFKSWGIETDATVGFGIGQYLSYAAAGGVCFKDALVLIYEQDKRASLDEPDWEGFEQLADTFNFYPPNLPMVCSSSGEVVAVHRSLGGSFWREFAVDSSVNEKSVQTFAQQECDIVLQIADGNGQVESKNRSTLSILNDSMEASASTLAVLGELYTLGVPVCFRGLYARRKCKKLSLPNYPFEKKRYWITEISKFMSEEDLKGVSQEVSE